MGGGTLSVGQWNVASVDGGSTNISEHVSEWVSIAPNIVAEKGGNAGDSSINKDEIQRCDRLSFLCVPYPRRKTPSTKYTGVKKVGPRNKYVKRRYELNINVLVFLP